MSEKSSEMLKERLIKDYHLANSVADSMVKSRSASYVLEILGSDAGFLEKLAITRAEEAAAKLAKQEQDLKNAQIMVESRDEAYQQDKLAAKMLRKQYEEKLKQIEEIRAGILSAETAEARDKIRLYEMYKADVEELEMTPQNRTAYIFGLASIMAGMPVWNYQPNAESTGNTKLKRK